MFKEKKTDDDFAIFRFSNHVVSIFTTQGEE